MIKTAVFVEGQTELIFTRGLILKYFEYQDVWVECYTLFNDEDLNPTEYSFPNQEAKCYFQILNVGNDNKVLSSILKREKYLFESNRKFDKIIGLRDMYSKDYREIVKSLKIDERVNEKFIEGHKNVILQKSSYSDKINFHFAIMELEAWLLGIEYLFKKFNDKLENETINTTLNIDLSVIDPEKEIFHPAKIVNQILEMVGDNYSKSKSEINKFMGLITREDIIQLLGKEKCNTFKEYCKSLNIQK